MGALSLQSFPLEQTPCRSGPRPCSWQSWSVLLLPCADKPELCPGLSQTSRTQELLASRFRHFRNERRLLSCTGDCCGLRNQEPKHFGHRRIDHCNEFLVASERQQHDSICSRRTRTT